MHFKKKVSAICDTTFSIFLSECIVGEWHCTKPNKDICNDNVCVCNTGFILEEDACIPCQSNQIVEKDVCSGNDACKNCPVGMHPTIDRRKCVDDETSPIMCTIDGYAVNEEQTDCVKGWYCPFCKKYTIF